MNLFYLGLFCAFQVLFLANGINGRTYSIIHPKVMRIDTEEKFLVNLHDYGSGPVTIHASFDIYPSRREIFSVVTKQGVANQPIEFSMKVARSNIPDSESIQNKKVQCKVRVRFRSGGFSDINVRRIIYLTGESDYIFVQTNRPIYKPGDRVEIRVIPLNAAMLPMRILPNREPDFVEITIQTSEGVGIYRAYDFFRETDFLVISYEIPENCPLGSYFVSAKINNTFHTSRGSVEFKVDKYVLPLYEVTLNLTKSYVKPEGSIDGSVTAKYSYGEPVKGVYSYKAMLTLPSGDYFLLHERPSSYRKRPPVLYDGVGEFSIPSKSLQKATTLTNMTWDELMEAEASISVTASVFGTAEQTFESAQKQGILITNTPYIIDVTQNSKYFVSGLEQKFNVIVRDIVTKKPIPKVAVLLIANGEEKHSRTDKFGRTMIPISIQSNENQIEIEIRTNDNQLDDANQAHTTISLTRTQSHSGYLRLTTDKRYVAVNERVYINLITNGYNPRDIYYMVLSRGSIVLFDKHTGNHQSETPINFQVTRKMSPSIRVIGYFMNGNTMVSNSLSLDIDDVCLSQELSISLDKEEYTPGERFDIEYKGQPNSLLGTSGVDRAAYFLNKKGRLDRKKMFEKMTKFDMGCSVSGGRNGLDVFQGAGLAFTSIYSTPTMSDLACADESPRRKKRSYVSHPIPTVHRKCGRDGRIENLANERCPVRMERIRKLIMSYSDMKICIKAFLEKCLLGEYIRNSSVLRRGTERSGSSVSGIDVDSYSQPQIRSNFAESWLWTKENLDHSGTKVKNVRAPDSITTYDIDAISVHNTEGFCVAKPKEIKIFQKFFIQLYLPYSVKVMEQVQIRAAIFNHYDSDLQVFLRIKGDEHLCTQYKAGEWSDVAELTVGNKSSQTHIFTVMPLSVSKGSVIELEAISELFSDTIKKELKIEPAGSEETLTGSIPLDPSTGSSPQQVSLIFPGNNILPDSKECWIYGHMNYLGPLIEFDKIEEEPKNLQNLIKLPGGCGEQNIMAVGPNIFILNYLKHNDQASEVTEKKIQKYIIDGYTRQQIHRNNGKWSVYSSSPPTIWINAYVNRIFLHACDVWPGIDVRPICSSLAWIINQQRRDGSFSEAKQFARYYSINLGKGGDVSLTAYVLLTVAETESSRHCSELSESISDMKTKAMNYLLRTVHSTTSSYISAITAYALALSNPRHPDSYTANTRLLNEMQENGDIIYWWNGIEQNPPMDIETTAYALLAQVTMAKTLGNRVSQSTVERINKIARGMVPKQNERGGFTSSQDTVVAIQAMIDYAKWIDHTEPPPRNPHIRMILTATGTQEWEDGITFNIDRKNNFFRKPLKIPEEVVRTNPNISITATGEGRGTLTYHCVYRQIQNSEKIFNISATTEMVNDKPGDNPDDGINVMKLVLHIQKNSDEDTGMAIIDVGLMSGFTPVPETLEAIKIGSVVDGVIDDFEIKNEKVIFYVEKIPGNNSAPLKFGFKLRQDVRVRAPNQAKIVVYDYYNPEIKGAKFYSVPDGSPRVRTNCYASSVDNVNEQICKCAEGICPMCRTRQDQLTKTCGNRTTCKTCSGNPALCENLHRNVCERNYGFIGTVKHIDHKSMAGFIKMNVTINDAVHKKSSDTGVDRNQQRMFIIREDCFYACTKKDDALKSLSTKDYFAVDRTYLFRGRQPEKITKSGNEDSFEYYLDSNGVIERTLTEEKCNKFEAHVRRMNCKARSNRRSDKCRNKLEKLKICENQKAMKLAIHEGCD